MLASLALGLAFSYSGCDLADFVQQYAAATRRPVVVAAARPAQPIEFEIADYSDRRSSADVANYVASRFGMEVCLLNLGPAGEYEYQAFRLKALPMWLAPGLDRSRSNAYNAAFPAGVSDLPTPGGMVKPVSLPAKYYSGDFLESVALSKSVKVHWLLKGYRFAACGTFASERAFLECVATALGGKLSESPSSFSIDLDAKVYRKQLVTYLQELEGGVRDPFKSAYIRFKIAALGAFADTQIAAAMATEKSYAAVDVPQTSPAGRAALSVVQAYLFEDRDPNGGEQSINKSRKQLIDMADLSKPIRIVLSSSRGVLLRLHASEGGNGFVEL